MLYYNIIVNILLLHKVGWYFYDTQPLEESGRQYQGKLFILLYHLQATKLLRSRESNPGPPIAGRVFYL